MDPLAGLSIDDVRARLTPERVRTFQILYAALCGGTMLFLTVIFFTYGLGSESPRAVAGDDTMRTLAMVLVAVAPLSWIAAIWMYSALLSGKLGAVGRTSGTDDTATPSITGDPVDAAIGLLRTAMLLRLAMFEGSALLGLVICFIGITDGVLFHYPVYFFCIVPACVFLFLIGTTFPTQERIAEEIRTKIIDVRR